MKHTILSFSLIIVFLFSGVARAEIINVAVASNFIAPMKAIAMAFEEDTDYKTRLISGSSGKLFAQITHGAPFQLFLSADQVKPIKLEESDKIVEGSRFTYALGSLVLWSSNNELIGDNPDILKQSSFSRLAIANPRLAPYGVAAVQTMKKLEVWDSLKNKLVMGESIGQTFQFVGSGNAEVGFVALSQVMQGDKLNKGSGWVVPLNLHDPIRQDAVLLASAKDHAGAQALLRFLKSDRALTIMNSFGYQR